MSLAMYAAPINDNNDNNEGLMYRKKQAHNKTQKKYPESEFNSGKVNSVLEEIHNTKEGMESDSLGDFTPPPPPQSAGVHRTDETNRATEQNAYRVIGKDPEPTLNYGDNLDVNNYKTNYGDSKTAEEYYRKMMPGYHPQRVKNYPYYSPQTQEPQGQDVLIQKLNYVINLLEEQQDERTGNVTEEVVLYSFLGIFIIFVVDSFARAGKYAR